MNKYAISLMVVLALTGAFQADAQDVVLLEGGPSTAYLGCPVTVSPATEQVTTSSAWILAVNYQLLNATSELKIKAGRVTTTTSALTIAGKDPLFEIGRQANKAEVVQFKYPLYASGGIILEATGAHVQILYSDDPAKKYVKFE